MFPAGILLIHVVVRCAVYQSELISAALKRAANVTAGDIKHTEIKVNSYLINLNVISIYLSVYSSVCMSACH